MASSFDYFEKEFPVIARLGKLAESYCETDPNSALYKIRKIGETITALIYQYDNLPCPTGSIRGENQLTRINALYDRGIINKMLAKSFTRIRKMGNEAVHEDLDSTVLVRELLPTTYSLCLWFAGTYGDDKNPQYKEYITPEKLNAVAKKRFVVKVKRPAEFTPEQKKDDELENKLIDQAISVASQAPKVQIAERRNRSYKANRARPLTEAETRELIDEQLRSVGWECDTKTLNQKLHGTMPQKGHNMAIAEWKTDSKIYNNGYADYALFIGEKLVGIIEAKAEHKDVSCVIDGQCKEYASLIKETDSKYMQGNWGKYKVPFAFATNGRPYLKQLETKSGIWFIDFTKPTEAPKALKGWINPIGIQDLLERDLEACKKEYKNLNDDDFLRNKDGLSLRDYQIEAIHAVDKALEDGQKNILLAMATGTGKTRTFLALIYRFLKTGRFKRILLLVDRNSLGKQAFDVFSEVKLDQLQPLTDIYNIKNLDEKLIDRETKLQISTVQGMVQRIIYNDSEIMPAVTDFDLVIIDEAHRGYILDKEMSDEELLFRDQLDYQSKYRNVIEYFDAVKIGFTATPALQTKQIFGDPVYTYSYRRAVYEGYLCDHDVPYIISTEKSRNGIHFKAGELVDKYNPNNKTVVENIEVLPDEIDYDIEKFNTAIITEPFNKAVLKELTDSYISMDMPDILGKTLIFAVDDHHADMIVNILKNICQEKQIPEEAVMKITGSAGGGNQKKIEDLIKQFKNESYPSVVVTVDLLSTGIDVPSITNLVFLRCVKSRILFEQMMGRATRRCPEINKTHFNVYDPAGVYDHIRDKIDMQPVVQNPSIKMTELIDSMKDVPDTEHKVIRYQIEQLLAKLNRKKNAITEAALSDFKVLTKEPSIESYVDKIECMSPSEAKKQIIHDEKVFELLQESKLESKLVIIDKTEDMNVQVSRGYGKNNLKRPEDYIEEFTAYIRDNHDKLEALKIVCTRPADLTRESLKNLAVILANEGYDLTSLNTAWNKATNADLALDIISVIRACANGSPIMSHEDRIKRAVQKLKAAHKFDPVELGWLNVIEANLIQENVLEESMFDREVIFRNKGGFKRIDKDFKFQLKSLISELNVYLYEDVA